MDQLINTILADRVFFTQLAMVVILLAILLSALRYLLGTRRWLGYGKIVGFILGFLIARAPGALIGLIFGHVFDIVVQPKRRVVRAQARQRVAAEPQPESYQLLYIDTLFAVLGNMAAANGQVTTAYLNQFNSLVESLQFGAEEQRIAWEWFQYGQHKDFNVRQALFAFTQHYKMNTQPYHALMQQSVKYAERIQPLNKEQYAILCNVAYALHLSTESFAHLAPVIKAEEASQQYVGEKSGDLYKILDLNVGATNKEIKWAYRKLMGRYHPDRLMSKDLPQDLIQLATRRTQEIKDAYEKICKERGI